MPDPSSALDKERRDRLTAAMAEEGWDTLLAVGNPWRCDFLGYASGFTTLEGQAFALIDTSGAVELIVETPAEATRAAGENPNVTVSWAADPVTAVAERLKTLGNRSFAVAPRDLMPHGLSGLLREGGFADGTGIVDRLMICKLPAEIEAVRKAAKLADEGYAAFREASRPGIKEYELTAATETYFRSRGCAENFMILGSGGAEVRGMHPPGTRVLQAGDMVTTELTPAVEGYYAQLCRTLVIGQPTADQQKAFDVYREAMDAGIAKVAPGVTAGEVATAENDIFRREGLGDYVTSEYTRVRGHGLGLYVDGRPALLEDVEMVLEPGMTLIVHPNTFNPVVGYVVLGDTVLVTESGCEVLTETPAELFSVGQGSA